MAEEIKMEKAKEVYAGLCAALDKRGWTYDKDEAKLMVRFNVSGEDIPMRFFIMVEAKPQIIRLMSPLPFKMSEGKRMEGAIATCVANYGMVDGSFDYNLATGEIAFRQTASYRESNIGDGLFQFMISCACAMVDKYNDRFLAIDKGFLSISDFIAQD